MGHKRDSESVWRDRLAKYSKSGLSVTEFCRQQGVSAPSFYQWRKRLSGSSRDEAIQAKTGQVKQASFLPVSVPRAAFVEIAFPNGLRVRVPASDPEALRQAMKAANDICEEVGRC